MLWVPDRIVLFSRLYQVPTICDLKRNLEDYSLYEVMFRIKKFTENGKCWPSVCADRPNSCNSPLKCSKPREKDYMFLLRGPVLKKKKCKFYINRHFL